MKIVKPLDWQQVTAADLDVIVEGERQEGLDCVLWTSAAFFGQGATEANALARAPVHWASDRIAHARLSGLQGWQDCVIALRAPGGGVLAASGVRLGATGTRSWMRHGLVLRGAAATAGLRHPVPVVGCARSHIPAAQAEPAPVMPVMPGLPALLDAPGPVAILPLLPPGTLDAHPVLDDMLCLGPGQDDQAGQAGQDDQARADRLLAASPYTASAPYLAMMHDVVAVLPAGLMLPGGTRLWSDSTHAAFWLDPELAQYPSLFRAHGELGLVLDRPRTERDLLADNERDALPGVPLVAFGNAWRNHGHWLMNTLFAAYLVRDAIAAGQVCVLVPEQSDYVYATLRAVGVPRAAILVARPGTYRFRRALFPSTLSIHANTFPPRAMADLFRHIARTAPDPQGAPGPDRVYVTRLGSATQRWMTNEAALIEALCARGFTVIAPHELGFEEEVRCFGRARVIVGQLGAGLLNAGFAPPGCRVVEITTHNYALNDVWFLCGVLGHRFSRIMAHGSTEDEFAVTPFTFELPLAPALALIDDVLNRL